MNQKDPQLRTDHVTDELVRHIVGRIVERVQPEKILLFGSRARETHHKDSDLDLMVIQNSGRKDSEIRREIDTLFFGRRFGMDILVRTPEEFEMNVRDRNPFYLFDILRDGKILYERRPPPSN